MRRRSRWLGVALSIAVGACGGGDLGGPTAPDPVPAPQLLGDPAAGKVAFETECAQCHASRDGYDLAFFEFTPFDVIRRALSHVDSATARDIAAHVESLDLAAGSMRRSVAPFQPAGRILGDRPFFVETGANDDLTFWVEALGTPGWPDGLTAAELRAIHPRDLEVPLGMPLWSLEGSDEDWMPERALPTDLLEYAGGALESAIDDYYASPSESNLLEAVKRFDEATKGFGRLCYTNEYERCFEARRWMASLGAMHYLRRGEDRVPADVARVWWDVGESEIALQTIRSGEARVASFRNGARWMYLAYSVQPEAFREPAGYMGTFLRSQGLDRTSLFATLRRMVGDGPAHAEHPDQAIEDGRLAITRSDAGVGLGVSEFVFGHLVDRLEAGRPLGLDLASARAQIAEAWASAGRFAWQDPARWARVRDLHDRVIALLQ